MLSSCRKTVYIVVRSTLKYGSIIWDPYPQKDIGKEWAIRLIKQDCRFWEAGPMTGMLEELGLPSLEARGKENRLCLTYRIFNDLIPTDYLIPLRNKMKIRAKKFGECEATNFVTSNKLCWFVWAHEKTNSKSRGVHQRYMSLKP